MRWLLLFCLAVSLLPDVPARTAPSTGPFVDVPVEHWSYDAIQSLAQRGVFTGYPDGTFSGRRALTRYEFAVAVQRMQQDVERSWETAWQPSATERSWNDALLRRTVLRRLGARRFFSELMYMVRLNTEFGAELRMLGEEPAQASERLEALVLGAQLTAPPRPADERAGWRRGVELARTEWETGRACLYNNHAAQAELHIDPELGLPINDPAERREADAAGLAEGHDNEVYHLILERGLPAGARREWLDEILHPQQVFEGGAATVARLDLAHRSATTRRREVHIYPVLEGRSGLRAVEVARDGETLTLHPFTLEARVSAVELVIGPATSDLLFLRFVERREGGSEAVYQVWDLRTGRPLKLERVLAEQG